MAQIETKWETRRPFSSAALECWAFADNTDDPLTVYDVSGKNRHLVATSNEPELQADILNHLPSIYFDGTNNPLKFTGNFTFKHAFVVAALDGTNFNANRGLLSSITTNGLLTGVNGTDKFEDFGYGVNQIYGKNYVDFANDNLKAPTSGKFAILEIVCRAGLSLDGLQIGQDRADTGKRWKGWFNELIVFSSVKNYFVRQEIYRYFAEKYHLWKELSNGDKIFPFLNDHQSSYSPLRYRIQSDPLPNGKFKQRIKGAKLQQFEFNFSNRRQDEILAIDKFETEFFSEKFMLEHNSFYPPRRSNVLSISDIQVSPKGINLYDYKFMARQTEGSQVLIEIPGLYLVEDGYFVTINGSFITV